MANQISHQARSQLIEAVRLVYRIGFVDWLRKRTLQSRSTEPPIHRKFARMIMNDTELKECYGTMFPHALHFIPNKAKSGKVFKFKVESVGGLALVLIATLKWTSGETAFDAPHSIIATNCAWRKWNSSAPLPSQ